MPRKLSLVLVLGLTAATLAACDRQAQTASPAAPFYAPAPSSAAAAPLVTPVGDAFDNRMNKPVRSGLNNDPDNPSGAPGPGTMKTMQ